MAKIPLAASTALISTIILTGLTTPSAHATGTLDNGLKYWTKDGSSEYSFTSKVYESFQLIALWDRYTYSTECVDTTSCIQSYLTIYKNGEAITNLSKINSGSIIFSTYEPGLYIVNTSSIDSLSTLNIKLTNSSIFILDISNPSIFSFFIFTPVYYINLTILFLQVLKMLF